jgi:hypothetical protein
VGSIHPLSAAGELLRVEDLLLRKNAALNPSESDEKIQQALSLAQIFYGARISDLVSVPKHSEFRQKFPCLSQQADTISPMPRPIAIGSKVDPLHTQIKQAHAEALTRRRQQIQMRAQIENEIKATHVSQERERHITSLVAKIQQTIRGSASDIPTRTQVQDWCSILGEPTLAAQYSSLYLTAIEAPKGGKTPVEAFVRKFLELLEKRAAREKNGQHNGSDNPRFHVKLDFSM